MAGGLVSTAMGWNTTASSEGSTAMGFETTASGDYATAMGNTTTASGAGSTAMGIDTEASGVYATAMGWNTTASGQSSTAMGQGTTASGENATAMGRITTASGKYATAMGRSTTAQAYASLTLGRFNTPLGNPDTWISSDPVLIVGNGSSDASRANALIFYKNGNLSIAGTLSQNSDRRLKTEIQPLSEVIANLAHLQPVRFRFRAGTHRPEGVHLGLIAQEVQAVFPELVQEGADGYLSVSYTNLTAVLVQALNEQQAEVEALKERLTRLEAALLRVGTEPAAPGR